MASRKSIKNNNRNYNDIIKEERPSSQVLRSSDEQKKNNFVDVTPTNNLVEELNFQKN